MNLFRNLLIWILLAIVGALAWHLLAQDPGYVLVHMIETSESWYLVRNTRGVTGFVGPDSKPVALTPEEVDMMLSTQVNSVEFGIAIGEEVRILSGPLENFTGVVEDVDTVRGKLTVKGFVRLALGEGVEKVQEDFAAEVASMMGGQ